MIVTRAVILSVGVGVAVCDAALAVLLTDGEDLVRDMVGETMLRVRVDEALSFGVKVWDGDIVVLLVTCALHHSSTTGTLLSSHLTID